MNELYLEKASKLIEEEKFPNFDRVDHIWSHKAGDFVYL